MARDRIGVGIIGAGGMGRTHAGAVVRADGAVVSAVMDADRARAQALAGDIAAWGQPEPVAVVDDATTAIGRDDVDALIIASPDPTHAPLALAALEAGKPVLVEKPLAGTAEAAADIMDRERASGRRLVQVGYMRRYDPWHAEVKAALEGGELGRPLVLRSLHRTPTPAAGLDAATGFRQGLVHDIDIIRWLSGQEVVEVSAWTIPNEQRGSDDLVLATLRLADGSLGLAELAISVGHGYEVETSVLCEHGEVRTAPPQLVRIATCNARRQVLPPDWLGRFGAAYEAEIHAFIDGVRSGVLTGPSARDGYAVQAVADACLVAAQSGAPVRLDLRSG